MLRGVESLRSQKFWQRAVTFLWLLAARPVLAGSVTLMPVADTSMFELSPDFNSGQSSLVAGRIRSGETNRARALVKFDLAAIPAGALITGATLTLEVVKSPAGGAEPSTFGLRRLMRDWGEGAQSGTGGGSPAATNEATWNARFHGTASWAAPGGSNGVDFTDAWSSTVPVGTHGSFTFPSTAQLVADVQVWLTTPGTNFGWLIASLDEVSLGTARRFASREYVPDSSRPTLTVDYLLPPAMLAIERVAAGAQLTVAFPANQTHRVEFRSSLTTNDWSLLTNFPAAPTNHVAVILDATTATQRVYRATAP